MAALLTSVTGKHGRRGEVHQRVPRDGDRGRTARHQRVSDANFTPHGERDPLRPGRGEERRTQRHRVDRRGAQEDRRVNVDIFEFCENVDLRLLNKRVLESLIKSGAMDALGRRAQLMAVIDRAIERAQKAQRDARVGPARVVRRLPAGRALAATNEQLPNMPDWDEHQRLAAKKKFSDSSSPAIRWRNIATSWRTCTRWASRRSAR